MRILVVDDRVENRYMLQTLLQGYGFQVILAEDGEDALAKALTEHVDLIISDILMPKMDGFRLCREWVKNEHLKHIPFVFYTATYTDTKDEEFALKLGACKYIIKPIEPEYLVEIINNLIGEFKQKAKKHTKETIYEEDSYLKEYNQRLIQKLQDKLFQISELEEKYRNLIEGAGDIIFSLDQYGKFSYHNSMLENKLEYETSELFGQLFSAILPPEETDKVNKNIKSILRGAKKTTFITEFVKKNGNRINFEVNLTPIFKKEETIGVQGIARDITERLHLEKRLRRSEKLASMAELASIIAHEIRNPLGAVTNSIGLLKNNLALDPTQQKLMRIVIEETNRIKSIINEFLMFSRLKQSHFIECQITPIMQETLLLLKEDERYHPGIQIKDHYQTNLPNVWIDPDQIRQVFWNLLINAIEAMPGKGCLEVRINKYGNAETEGVTVEIADTGTGIDRTELNKIFEPFYTTKKDGSGLGLPVVQQVIETHGGSIDIDSQKGKGSKIILFLSANLPQ